VISGQKWPKTTPYGGRMKREKNWEKWMAANPNLLERESSK
jgi:hypothetical protein